MTWTDMATRLSDVAHNGVFVFNFKQTFLLVPLFLQAIFYSVKIFARGNFFRAENSAWYNITNFHLQHGQKKKKKIKIALFQQYSKSKFK